MKAAFPGIVLMLCSHMAFAQPRTGEFGGQSVDALAEGKHVATDCSVTWTDKDEKVYCFSDERSRSHFLQDSYGNLERAREFAAAIDSATTTEQMTRFGGDDVKSFVEAYIKKASADHGGSFPFHDAPTNQDLELAYDQMDFMRTLAGYGFFPEAIFHAKEDPEKKYLVDFWVKPRMDKPAELTVVETRIYKGPKREGAKWTLASRLPTPWWWLPASEHPGSSEQTRAWEVMSAVDGYIEAQRGATNRTIKVKDDKTGEELTLDLVGIHQPVRRLQDNGRYFACTDFRKKGGGPDEVYDLDFWVNEKDNKMSVDEVRVHKVPQKVDGHWTQVPRYNFDKMKFDEVP
jgi:hypothetical protein